MERNNIQRSTIFKVILSYFISLILFLPFALIFQFQFFCQQQNYSDFFYVFVLINFAIALTASLMKKTRNIFVTTMTLFTFSVVPSAEYWSRTTKYQAYFDNVLGNNKTHLSDLELFVFILFVGGGWLLGLLFNMLLFFIIKKIRPMSK